MPDKRLSIELLLGSQYDQLWFPAGSLSRDKMGRGGEAAGAWVKCDECGGIGEVERFRRMEPCHACAARCDTCGGTGFNNHLDEPCKDCATVGDRPSGYVWAKGHKGEVHIDRYTEERVGSSKVGAASKPRKRVKCDACQDIKGVPQGVIGNDRCDRCDGTGWRDQHVFDLALDLSGDRAERWKGIDPEALFSLEDGRLTSRRDQAGSYRELEQALAALARASYSARRLVDQVYAFQIVKLDTLTVLAREKLEFGMKYLELRMPDPVRVPADVVANRKIRANHKPAKGAALNGLERERRDTLIREQARAGVPYDEIQAANGLKERQVREIINSRRVA